MAAAGCLVGLAGCPPDVAEPPAGAIAPEASPEAAATAPAATVAANEPSDPWPASEASPEDGLTFRKHAHQAAFRRTEPLTRELLIAAFPVTAAELGLAPLALPSAGPSIQAALHDRLQRAVAESRDLDASLLEGEAAAAWPLLESALARIATALSSRDPRRSDPNVYVDELQRFTRALERVLTQATADRPAALHELAKHVAEIPGGLARARNELGGASVASLAGARTKLRDLGRSLLELQVWLPATPDGEALAAALQTAHASVVVAQRNLADLSKALSRTTETPWGKALVPARGVREITRLADRLGANELRQRVQEEERLSIEPRRWLELLERTGKRLEELSKTVPPRTGRDPTGPWSIPRCQKAHDAILATLPTTSPLRRTQRGCDGLPEPPGDRPWTEAALSVDVLDRAFLIPYREDVRRQAAHGTGLVEGHALPRAHLEASRIAVAARLGPGPLSLALASGRTSVCQAAVALFVHASLGTEAELATFVKRNCKGYAPKALRSLALEQPREALSGLGLALIVGNEATLTASETLWWLPFGLVWQGEQGADTASGTRFAPVPRELTIEVEDLGPNASPAPAASPASP